MKENKLVKAQKQSKKVSVLKKRSKQKNNVRLALDIGTNSIGWAAYNLDKQQKKPISIAGVGVRIFSSGRKDKDYTTLNATRRQKRLQRRQRDRYLQRRDYLIHLLKKHGLFPKPELAKKLEKLNPYELRATGLDEKLNIHHFGRALFHINKKRGFKSNRKSGDEKKSRAIQQSIEASDKLMKEYNSRTYGEFLWKRFEKMEKDRKQPCSQQKNWILARKAIVTGTKNNYAVYPDRKMMENEFNKLWKSQSRFHDQLNNEIKGKFFKVIFFQRNLKQPIIGNCVLTGEKRISKALPSFQKFRILKELNNLAYINDKGETSLITKLKQGLEFRDKIINDLFLKNKEVKFSKIEEAFKDFFRKVNDFSRFKLKSFNRDDLEGEKTNIILKKIMPQWPKWSLEVQDRFIELLEGENDEGGFIKDDDEILEDLEEFQEKNKLNVSKKQLDDCLKSNQLPNNHGKYSQKAIQQILPFLKKGEQERQAIQSAGLNHKNDQQIKLLDRLPPYQDILEHHCVKMSLNSKKGTKGIRIPNPTVHIAFNQLKLLVNDIIRVHGKPSQIVIETARDLPYGAQTQKEEEEKNKKKKEKNKEADKVIEEFGQEKNKDNRIRYYLWKEQKNTCVYSGKKIPKCSLWTAKLEVDHILPWSQTLDDSFSNKVLVYKSTNQDKSNKTPFECFSSDRDSWKEISNRVKELPKNKQWRFDKDAMKTFLKDEKDFLARQLNDTRYISKHAKDYLKRICEDVWTVRGQTTSILRHSLLKAKNRDDYRNHAEDALVVGLIDRSFVQHISDIAKRIEEKNKERMTNIRKAIQKEILPWPSFSKDAKDKVDKIIVSHRKRTKLEGQLHNETAYGFSSSIKDFSEPIDVTHYADLLSFDKYDETKIKEKIISHKIKKDFLQELGQKTKLSKEFLEDYHKNTGIRRVRIKEKNTVIPIKNKFGKLYKAFKGDGNYAMKLFKNSKGKWDGKVINRFEANQKSFKPISKKIRLMIGDLLHFDNKYWRVVKLSSNKITFSEHFEANVDARNRDKKKQYKYKTKTPGSLEKKQAKRVNISPCGIVKITNFDL